MLLEGQTIWHGSEAIAEISRRMSTSAPLLVLLQRLFADDARAKWLYPGLLAARRAALMVRGLSSTPIVKLRISTEYNWTQSA